MKSLLFAAAALTLMASVSMAAPKFGDGGWALQNLMDDITVGGPSSVDVTTDYLSDSMDSLWSIGAPGGLVTTIVMEIAGNACENTFGIYDAADISKTVEVFAGSDSQGDMRVIGIAANGSVIKNFGDTGIDFAGNLVGFYLSTPRGNTFYSDTSRNADGLDHMYAYQGVGDTIQIPSLAAGVWQPNEYIMCWADLYGGGDRSYNDFVVIVESVTPIPEPTTLVILGLGSLGLLRLRKKS